LFNIRGRTRRERWRVLARLARKRGVPYLADLLLGRWLRTRYLGPGYRPFPEITAGVAAELRRRCRYVEVDNPHAPETLRQVAAYEPDYVLLLGAPVLRPEFFTLARRGTLNWHHGIAPRYRGSDCVLWAMANGEFDQNRLPPSSACPPSWTEAECCCSAGLAVPHGRGFRRGRRGHRPAGPGGVYVEVVGRLLAGDERSRANRNMADAISADRLARDPPRPWELRAPCRR
jgi:hypothetical protein